MRRGIFGGTKPWTKDGDAAAEGSATPGAAGPEARPDVIVLNAVSRSYHVGGGTVTALSDVSLRIGSGELVVILGPSGSGKSTLLNLIGALDVPTSGTITIAGRRIDGASRADLFRYRRESVSFVFQTFNLFPTLTALENVEFGVEVSGRRDRGLARRTLEDVGLSDRLHHFPGQLSSGEQQRVAIARALATGNPILLADEPTGELDFQTGVQILGLLGDHAKAGRSVVVVTHNREIARAADRVVELSSGRVVADGPPPGGPADIHELRW